MLFSLVMKHLSSIPVLAGHEQKPAKLDVQLERDEETFFFLLQTIPAQSFTMTGTHAEKLGSVLKKK